MLLYADDIVLLANSLLDAQKKLDILLKYCTENSLTVNISKTKVLPFHRGRLARQKPLLYAGIQLEFVSTYCYLGVIFSRSGKFLAETKYALGKTNIAINGILKTLILTKCKSWEAQMQLFDSIAKSVLLYGAEIWGLKYTNEIEAGQSKFVKRILQCSSRTPNYLLRPETGIKNMAIKVWERALGWWNKLLSMPNDNITKILYNRLVYLDHSPTNLDNLNWATAVKNFLISNNSSRTWSDQTINKNSIKEIIDIYSKKLLNVDITKIENSTYNPAYKHIKLNYSCCEPYLLFQISISKKRIISQLRLANVDNFQIYCNNNLYKFDANNNCTICNLQVKETLNHFLQVCPIYKHLRTLYLTPITTDISANGTVKLLQPSTMSHINNIYLFTVEALKLRSFIINE